MRTLTARDLGRAFISLDDWRKVLQDFPFVTDTGYGIFLLSSNFYEGDSDLNSNTSRLTYSWSEPPYFNETSSSIVVFPLQQRYLRRRIFFFK